MNIKFGRSQSHTPEDIRTSDFGFRSLYSLISITYYCLEHGLMPLLSVFIACHVQDTCVLLDIYVVYVMFML